MKSKRKIEIFSAGCAVCEETIALVNKIACPSCEVSVEDMKDSSVMERARKMRIRSVPALVVDGSLLECCSGRGPEEWELRLAGIGQPIS